MTAPAAMRPPTDEYAAFRAGYVSLVPDGDIVVVLRSQLADTLALMIAQA